MVSSRTLDASGRRLRGGPTLLLASYHTLRRSRPHPTVMLQPTETRDEFVPPRALSAPSGGTMTRRRTDNRHRGDARGLARRRSNPDAARSQAENRTGTPSGSAPSSPRTATSLWFRITSEGRPPDEGADARRPRGDRLLGRAQKESREVARLRRAGGPPGSPSAGPTAVSDSGVGAGA